MKPERACFNAVLWVACTALYISMRVFQCGQGRPWAQNFRRDRRGAETESCRKASLRNVYMLACCISSLGNGNSMFRGSRAARASLVLLVQPHCPAERVALPLTFSFSWRLYLVMAFRLMSSRTHAFVSAIGVFHQAGPAPFSSQWSHAWVAGGAARAACTIWKALAFA